MAHVDWHSVEFQAGFRQGEPAVLEALYWAHVGVVEHVLGGGFVTRAGRVRVPGVGDADLRADLLQEVFLKAFSASARASFDANLDYRPYLLTIARHVLVDHHRRRGRDRIMLPLGRDGEIAAVEDGPTSEWRVPEYVRIVERYVSRLTSPLREVHELRFVREQSQRDAARALGISRQNLRTFEARLKSGLKRELEASECEAVAPEPALGPQHGVAAEPALMRSK